MPHCGDEDGESPPPLHLAVHHRKQQVGNQTDPYLRLDGIDTFTVEILQWKVLFYRTPIVKNLTGKDVKTEDEIVAALDELEECEQKENDDVFYSFHKFTINEEDEP